MSRWNRFRTLCDSNKKLGVVLELTADLPSEREIERWLGEPVKALVIPTAIFITNKKGFPVLSRAHQNVVRSFLKVRLSLSVNRVNKCTCVLMLYLSSYVGLLVDHCLSVDRIAMIFSYCICCSLK